MEISSNVTTLPTWAPSISTTIYDSSVALLGRYHKGWWW